MTRTPALDVIVVGAGLSGLRAAVELHEAGYSVLVLEARDRVGGKTLSIDVPGNGNGGKVDVGAAWINDTNQSEMYKLAIEFGFDLVKQRASGSNLHRDANGELVRTPHEGSRTTSIKDDDPAIRMLFEAVKKYVATAHPEKPHLTPDAKRLDKMTFAKFAQQVTKSEVGVAAANHLTAALLGVEAEETSALFVIDYIQSGTGLDNMGSDLKDGGQYLRNRQGEIS